MRNGSAASEGYSRGRRSSEIFAAIAPSPRVEAPDTARGDPGTPHPSGRYLGSPVPASTERVTSPRPAPTIPLEGLARGRDDALGERMRRAQRYERLEVSS